MSHSLAAAEPYVTSFEATVERADGRELVLDETYFYPEGGGQPADRGLIDGIAVEHVRSDGDEVVHVLEEGGPDAGETVACAVDPAFRTYCMRAHTASHVLYGSARGLLDDLGYGGFGIDERKVRIDFETSSDVDDATLVELERRVERAVWNAHPVSWETVPREDALARDDVAFNDKTEEGATGESVRLVTVEGIGDDADPFDIAACGGTHVENTSEIGPVTILERSNPGEGLTRIEFAVGPGGIDRRAEEKAAALDAASEAGTSVDDLPEAVARFREERDELEAELRDLTSELVEARITELCEQPIERDGHEWVVGTVDGVTANDLAGNARALAGDAADVIVLVGQDGRTFVAVAAGDGIHAGEIVDDVTDEFGGGGGGSPEFAQGGGIDADPDDVVEYLL